MCPIRKPKGINNKAVCLFAQPFAFPETEKWIGIISSKFSQLMIEKTIVAMIIIVPNIKLINFFIILFLD